MKSEVQKLAENYLIQLTRHIYKLIIIEKRDFNLIIAAGNSGLAVAQFLKMIYTGLDIIVPPVLEIPIMRFINENNKKLFDNSVLLEDIKSCLAKIEFPKTINILFVDDEIRYGSTAKNALNLIKNALDDLDISNNIKFTIVADEFGGFNWKPPFKSVFIDYRPFIKHTNPNKNIILYNMPHDIFIQLRPVLNKLSLEERTAINILLDLPLKEKRGEIAKPAFSFKYSEIINREIPNLTELKINTREYVQSIIKTEIEKLKSTKV